MEANSQPMAPPPMTAADAGSLSSSSTWSLVRIFSPSGSNPGIVRGTDPVASTTCLPCSWVPSSTVTRWPAPREPVPAKVVILRFFIRPWRPFQSWSTTFCLRARETPRSSRGWSACTPNSLAPATVRNTEAVSR